MKTTTLAGAVLLLALSAVPVLADDIVGQPDGTFALGVQLGAADGKNGGSGFSGITARFGRDRTIEGVLAFNPGGTWIVNGNFLLHSSSLFQQHPISAIKLYGGFGLGAWTGGDGGFWAQVPLGVDFDFSLPIEASVYVAPGLDILPSTAANVHFGLGVRYWF
ncbi:MAG TPA: hypothetical protein VN931_08580 [Fibrobacteria bacterium]|nr:hypothetical protein [Fibrobacteria bacterium]